MAPREKEFSAAVLVIDVGVTSHSSGFLQTGIRCATELLQRKLIAESNDKFGIVLVGSEKTDNPLKYDNVTLVNRELHAADWELLELLGSHVSGTFKESDWLDAVVVALHYLKENTEGHAKCVGKKIVLISDLGCPVDESHLNIIITNMKKEGVEFTFFGPEWHQEEERHEAGQNGEVSRQNSVAAHAKPKTPQQESNETMIKQLVEATDGLMCDINLAIANLTRLERRAKKGTPWKVTLEIGSGIKINTVGYIQVRREAPKSWKKCLARPVPEMEEDELKPDVAFVKNNENQDVIEPSNIIESYKYGSQRIVVTEEDKESNKYDGGPKSMMLIGFVSLKRLERQYFLGDGCMVFQPVENDEHAAIALSALAYAMQEMQHAAIVRKVYRAGCCPRLGALIPEYKENDDGNQELILVYVELPYMEDVRDYEFAPVYTDKLRPSAEQLESVENLIDSMMLAPEGGRREDDHLSTETILNPYYQHLYRCLAFRALHPGQVLPEVAEDIKRLMRPPQEVQESAKNALEKIAELFPLEEVEKKKDKVTGEKLFADKSKRARDGDEDAASEEGANKRLNAGDLALQRSTLTEVGTTTPVEDFQRMLKNGDQLLIVTPQLERVIEKLVKTSFGSQMFDKICSCLQAYRDACLERKKPELYNDYAREFKHMLVQLKKTDLLLEMASKSLGLISSNEHGLSNVDAKDANAFLMISGEVSVKESSVVADEEDNDDLLDQL